MANVCVSVPEGLKKRMEGFPIINWSEIARNAFTEQVRQLELLRELTKNSKATEKDIEELAGMLKKRVAARHAKK